MGRMRLVENGRHAGEAALLAIVMELIDIMVLYWLGLQIMQFDGGWRMAAYV